MEIDYSKPIGRIAVEISGAVSLFEKYGIDYYREAEKELVTACSIAGAPLDQVESELKKIKEPIPALWYQQEPDWSRETMASLIHYIVQVHHTKARSLLDDIVRELDLSRETKQEPGRLQVLRNLFLEFEAELRNHLLEEEETIFLYLIHTERALEKGQAPGNLAPMEKGFSNSIREILFEHRFMDRGFEQIEKLMHLINDEASAVSLKNLVEALSALKKDNEKHVHLENRKLFGRSAQLGLMD